MRRRDVVLLDSAEKDLTDLGVWLVEVGSLERAHSYLARVRERIQSLEYGSERGSIRDKASGMRVIGMMPSISVAFVVKEDAVLVHRVLYRGRNWQLGIPDDGKG